jgi:hypothetical protein
VKLTAAHMAMLRDIHRLCPTPYVQVFRRDEVCSSIEDIVLLRDLAMEGMLWFKGYVGPLRMEGTWAITRAGADGAGRRPPARAAEPLPDDPVKSLQAGWRGSR